jgi:glycosyltransferase involved in cell wall biosynthesis
MKIAILNKYQFSVNRGAETFVFALADRLSVKHEVDILTKIDYLHLIKKKYDVIVPTNGREQVFLTKISSVLTGSKIVVSGQSGIGLDDRLNLYALPHVFVGLTSFQSKWAKKINPLVNIRTIPNGVDLNFFKPQKNKSLNSKIILAVGAFTKEKGHDLTIRAVSKIPGAELIIAGNTGEEYEQIRNLGNELLGKRFRVISTSHDKMPEIYKSASVFVYPTVPWESFGIAMLEAMAVGLPVVASNDPIRREIVGNAGLFINPRDVNEYSRSLIKALKTDWGNIPRKRAENFSWDLVAASYDELFEEITGKK